MAYRSIYTYPWDLLEVGRRKAIEEFLALGVDTVTIAGSYHAGKFLRPHGGMGKVYFPEDGTIYFAADPTRYGAIKPVPNSMLAERDILGEVTQDKRLSTNVWLVLLHNTRLGQAHSDAAVTNAFGDKYAYNLCPSAPEARTYAVALARDVTERYEVSGVSMETPGYLPYYHGFHHEFALNMPNRWLDSHLGLCFCKHCISGAQAANIDAQRLRAQVAKDVSDYLASDADFLPDMGEAFWFADTRLDKDLSDFLDWRCTVVTSLVAEIRAVVRKDVNVAVIPSVARPNAGAWFEGSDLKALAEAAGIIEACFYEPSAQRVKAELFDITRRLRGSGKLRAILRPAYPDLDNEREFLAAMNVLAEGGVREFAFYNWGHLRTRNLAWIARGLKLLESRG